LAKFVSAFCRGAKTLEKLFCRAQSQKYELGLVAKFRPITLLAKKNMSLWTFRASVVPHEAIGECRQLSEAQYDDLYSRFWEKRDGEKAARHFAALLPPLKSWDSRVSLFGREGSDRIEVWRESGRVCRVTLKVDCRTPNLVFVDAVEAVGVEHRLLFIYNRTFDVCEPGIGALRQFVLSSASCRALKDPERWLPHLAAEVKRREENG
jgi:hypothetical protein